MPLYRYDTPLAVAKVLAMHAPRTLASVLDPAVGSGILLEPLLSRISKSGSRLVCMDADGDALQEVGRKLKGRLGNSLSLLHRDFLEWSSETVASFDCIVMNPPFQGRKDGTVKLDLPRLLSDPLLPTKYVQLEAAFLLSAVRLLKPRGRLLAIVPSSIVAGHSTEWIRSLLLKVGKISYVHELPAYTFKAVEARVYLFVFEKIPSTNSRMVLCNHDLNSPERLVVGKESLGAGLRLDHAHNSALAWYRSLKKNLHTLKWMPLAKIAKVYRGSIQSPAGVLDAIHTTEFRNGFWREPLKHRKLKADGSDRGLRMGDLLVKRVGRGAAASFGPAVANFGKACSDCLFIVRPGNRLTAEQLLFAIRVLVCGKRGAALIEKGTGAAYLTEESLVTLDVPFGLSNLYNREFLAYVTALNQRDMATMVKLENAVRIKLHGQIGGGSPS